MSLIPREKRYIIEHRFGVDGAEIESLSKIGRTIGVEHGENQNKESS